MDLPRLWAVFASRNLWQAMVTVGAGSGVDLEHRDGCLLDGEMTGGLATGRWERSDTMPPHVDAPRARSGAGGIVGEVRTD